MHSGGQQQQRRGNSTRMPMIYSNSLPPGPLLPNPTLRYGGPGTYQQPSSGSGGMKHHQPRGGNRGGRNSIITHRQQRPILNSRYHPYPFRQPLPPQQQQQQQRLYRPQQPIPRTPAALMGTPPGMSQSEYELIHSAQVQRDKKKLDVLAPSNTTQFLINDHNRQTPSTIATPTPTHQTNSSPSTTQNQSSLPYDQMFEMNEVDAQSDDTESVQDFGLGAVDPSVDDDFNDIYYQCRYERYAAFSRANLLKEVLSLCANIDRLQYEKSEVEKRLRDVQQHLYSQTNSTTVNQDRSTNDDNPPTTTDDDFHIQSPIPQTDSTNPDDHPNQPLVVTSEITQSEENNSHEEHSSELNGNEQQIVHD